MYHRASELKHIFNENMKGGTGTVEIIHSVNPIDYESPAKMIAKLILRPGCSLGSICMKGKKKSSPFFPAMQPMTITEPSLL